MRRLAGVLIPIETAILAVLLDLQLRGAAGAHGYAIAKAVQDRTGATRLTGYGTLYKALERLERSAVVDSAWEHPEVAALEGRPRRRYYRITAAGATALAEAERAAGSAAPGRVAARRAEAPST